MKNTVSIFAGHDSNITFYDAKNDKYHVIELERLLKKRYFRLHVDNDPQTIIQILSQCRDIAEKYWGIENDYDAVITVQDGWLDPNIIREVFNTNEVRQFADHHHSHAAGS